MSIGSKSIWCKALFRDQKVYYYRAYALTPNGVVFGNLQTFIGKRNCIPVISEYFPKSNLQPEDTITVVGRNFNFYRGAISALWQINSYSPINVIYVNKDTIKLAGTIVTNSGINVNFGNNIKLNIPGSFQLYNIKNVRIDKTTAFIGDTLTISWDGKLPRNTQPILKSSYNLWDYTSLTPLKVTDNSVTFVVPANFFDNYNTASFVLESLGTKFLFQVTFNSDAYYNYDLTYNEEERTYLIKYKRPILDKMPIELSYKGDVYKTEVVDPYTLKVYLPSEKEIIRVFYTENYQISKNSFYGSDILPMNFDFYFKNGYPVKGYKLDYKLSIGKIISDFSSDAYDIEQTGNKMCLITSEWRAFIPLWYNFDKNTIDLYSADYTYNGRSFIKKQNSSIYYLNSTTSWGNLSILATSSNSDFKTGAVYTFTTGGPTDRLTFYKLTFENDNKLYFVGRTDMIDYNEIYSFNISTLEFKKENFTFPFSSINPPGVNYNYGYNPDREMTNLMSHNLNGNIYLEMLKSKNPNVYRFNPTNNSFELVSTFPEDLSNKRVNSYSINDKWYVISGSSLWTFDGSQWTKLRTLPLEGAGVYFEMNGKKYLGGGAISGLFELNE